MREDEGQFMYSIPLNMVLMTLYLMSVSVNFVLFDFMEDAAENRGKVAIWRRRATVFIGLRISLLSAWMYVFFYLAKKDTFASFVIGTHLMSVLIEAIGFIYAILVDKARSKFTMYYFVSVSVQILVSLLMLIITVLHISICEA